MDLKKLTLVLVVSTTHFADQIGSFILPIFEAVKHNLRLYIHWLIDSQNHALRVAQDLEKVNNNILPNGGFHGIWYNVQKSPLTNPSPKNH